ncbi:DUF1840 domain-containing protein [Lampropedia puyangensis]|uniref:DUF1840 domain-containing protein n=1 Tax=Lampropedia puyangensis TaxID=1330072 RepID=A0A4S8FB20_9BURK|nr:DUF1840 domain-containing protein [Lampropedia puyangensis]THU04429.1 DUF1840 domain-containing protein [Lampropedia puyangensis]
MIKFTAHSSAPIQYLNADAKRLLNIMGKDGDSVQGIITQEQLPAALHALEQAISQEQAQGTPAQEHASTEHTSANEADEPGAQTTSVTLKQRAQPLLQLLRTAQQNDEYVVWGD